MIHFLRYTIAFYVMIALLGNLFGGCEPNPPREMLITDAFILPSIPQPQSDFEISQEVDMEVLGPLLNSILPNRSPLEGTVSIRIVGEDFRAPMYARVGEQRCQELTVNSRSRMTCLVPSVTEPQKVDIKIAWGTIPNEDPIPDESIDDYEGGLKVISEGLTYYEPLTVESIEPNIGPASGRSEVIISGQGFSESTDVKFGTVPALSVTVEDEQTLIVLTPRHPTELVDVTVRDPSGTAILEEAFTFQTPLGVDQILPRLGLINGGDSVELYGFGFTADSEVRLGDQDALVNQIFPPARISITTPSALQVGWADIEIKNINGVYFEPQAFLYLDDEIGPFQVFGSIPQRLPSDLGGTFMIGGNGFNEETIVKLDDIEISCTLESAQRLQCFAPRHPIGEAEITVWQSLLNQSFILSFYKPLELFFVEPDRSAISGGALLQARGRGFTPDNEFLFGDQVVTLARYVSDEEVWLQAPPHPPSVLDITVRDNGQQVFLPESFTYFDPQALYGGSWGEPIENAVNVTVLNIYDFSPVPEVTVEARPFLLPVSPPLLSGRTNENGQVTLSAELLESPLHLNIAKTGFEAQTVERVVSENLTVLLFPFTPPEGEGDPPPSPEPVTIQGMLTGLNELEKPPDPGMVLRAFIDISHRGMLSRSTNPPPMPLGILAEDGPFELLTKPGQMSLIATAAYVPIQQLQSYERGDISYWFMRKSTYPIKMGLIRFLSLSPGAEIGGLTLDLSHDLDQIGDIRLLNPPSGAGSIYTNSSGEINLVEDEFEVRAFLDLEADGYWELDVNGVSNLPTLALRGLPQLNEWGDAPQLVWLASSRVHPNGVNSYVEHEQSDLNRSIEIGPFVSAAKIIEPTPGDTISVGDTLRWEPWPGVDGQPTEPPQASTIRFYQAGLPVWSFTLPGGVNELTIPPIPPAETGAGPNPGSIYVSVETIMSEGGINYQDFNLLDLNSPSRFSTTRFGLMFNP